MKLAIRGKKCCELKSQTLTDLQLKFLGVKYLIIDKFSVMGQNMFGWIDRCLRQVTGKQDVQFSSISIILARNTLFEI